MTAPRAITLAPEFLEGERPLGLMGLMGAGKTTLGRAAALALGRPFVDLDAEIEREAGASVAALFAAEGEAGFRARETRALARILEPFPWGGRRRAEGDGVPRAPVIALGGGAVLSHENRRLLRDRARVIWLRARPATLARRLSSERGEGPLATGDARPRDPAPTATPAALPTRPLLSGATTQADVEARLAALLADRAALYDDAADRILDVDDRSPEDLLAPIEEIAAGRRTRVSLGEETYGVTVEPGALRHLGRLVRRALAQGLPLDTVPVPRCALVADGGLPPRCAALARQALDAEGLRGPLVTLPGGEPAKRFSEVERLLEAFVEGGLDRESVVVALGGGACTDAAGLAAALFARGVRWVAVPTTLLGMVDAAIGGKTAVDLRLGKNLAGAFHQPRLVVADPLLLASLPQREWQSGLGEVVKSGLIGPAEALDAAEALVTSVAATVAGIRDSVDALARDPATRDAILLAAALKGGVVSRDERETLGERKTLNFGHTIGHAFEAAMAGRLPHGAAVLHGMRAALHLARAKGLLPEADHDRALALIARAAPPPLDADLDPEALLAYVLRDKKVSQGRLLFVLLEGLGRPLVDVEVSREEALLAIAFAREGGGRPAAS